LNPRSLIQPLETLLVELTRTHYFDVFVYEILNKFVSITNKI